MISDVKIDDGEVKLRDRARDERGAKRRRSASRSRGDRAARAKSVELRWSGELAGARRCRPRPLTQATLTAVPGRTSALPGVKHVILVMSGKGASGSPRARRTSALALKRAGNRRRAAGRGHLRPASIPTMLGVMGRPVSSDGKTIDPLERFGVEAHVDRLPPPRTRRRR